MSRATKKRLTGSRSLSPSPRRRCQPRVEFLEPRLAPANVDVLSWHNDGVLSGANNQEEILTPANVSSGNFGMLFSYPVDGQVYAQPLYKANLAFPDGSTHNAVFVATEHDSVYAFDGDNPSNGPNGNGLLWQRSFIDPANGIRQVSSTDVGSGDISPDIGITGTPVINGATNTLYVIVKTKETRSNVVHFVQRLHALDITTGQDVQTPYVIGDTTGTNTNSSKITVSGNGDGSIGGIVTFNALKENDRSALLLSPDGSVLYADWASHGDQGPYHGWVVAFDAQTLQPLSWFNTTPNSGLGGIWQSGAGVAIDPNTGNIFFATGNSKQSNLPPGDLGESVVELNTNGKLSLVDYFTPSNKVTLDQNDTDLGSGGTMILPDQPGPFPHLIVETGKQGTIYVLNRDDLGKYKSGTNGIDRVVQEIPSGVQGVWSSPSFFLTDPSNNSGLIYYHGQGDVLRSFRLLNGRLTPIATVGKNSYGFPGAQPSVSSNGTQDGIVWEIQTDGYSSGTPAVLHAYDALNLSKELYRSDRENVVDTRSSWVRDQLDSAVKFTVPTITNGHVYIGSGGTRIVAGQSISHYSVSVFGLFDPSTDVPDTPVDVIAMTEARPRPLAGFQVEVDWTNVATDATGIRVQRSTNGVTFTTLTTLPRTATSYIDTSTLNRAAVYYYRVIATNQHGDGAPSSLASVSTPGNPVLSLANICSTEIDLTWTRTGNDHYDIERSSDGTNFAVINPAPIPSTVTNYSDVGLIPGTYYYRIRSINASPDEQDLSNVVSAQLPTDLIDHSAGFSVNNDLTANGSAVFADGFARLTVGAVNEAGTIFSNTKLSIATFTTSFMVRIHEGSDPRGEGFTFILQGISPTQLGQGGGGLGYAGIGQSVAIKFDIFKPAGNHSSTGLYVNGDPPNDAPDIGPNDVYVDLDGTGIDFNNQRIKQVNLAYDGTTLTETITDTVTGDSFTTSYTIDLPSILGGSTAYIGFGGGTSDPTQGGGTCLQDILNWVYAAPTTLPGAPSNLTGTAGPLQVLLTWQCNSINEDGYAVEQSTDGVNFTQIGTTARGVTSYVDMPAQAGTYYYRVRAFNVAGSSDYSNIFQVDVPDVPPPGGGGQLPGGRPRQFALQDATLLLSTFAPAGPGVAPVNLVSSGCPSRVAEPANGNAAVPVSPTVALSTAAATDGGRDGDDSAVGEAVAEGAGIPLGWDVLAARNAVDEWFLRSMEDA